VHKKAGVNHDSYAEEIIQRTYEWYIDSAIDLKTEFAKYYQPEYRNIKLSYILNVAAHLRMLKLSQKIWSHPGSLD